MLVSLCVCEVVEFCDGSCRYDYSGYGQSTGKVCYLIFFFLFCLTAEKMWENNSDFASQIISISLIELQQNNLLV